MSKFYLFTFFPQILVTSLIPLSTVPDVRFKSASTTFWVFTGFVVKVGPCI